jgi:hypothetical protein
MRFVQRLLLPILLLTLTCVATGQELKSKKLATAPETYAPQVGDLWFQSLPHGAVIDTIEGSTHSPYSHCGILVKQEDRWQVLEAIGPVKFTPASQWIAQGRGNQLSCYRLKVEHQRHIPGMIAAARQMVGKPYDIQYEFDDAKIYCSELIFKAYRSTAKQDLGKRVTLGQLDWKPYEQVVRAITGGTVPLGREMITPRDLAAASQLDLVRPWGSASSGMLRLLR